MVDIVEELAEVRMPRHLKDVEDLFSSVLAMGGLVEEHFAISIEALKNQDYDILDGIFELEKIINHSEIQIDESCALLIAKNRTAAQDLRTIFISVKAVSDLERIGDETMKIARLLIKMRDLDYCPDERPFDASILEDVISLAEKSHLMLKHALDALARRSIEESYELFEVEEDIDLEYHKLLDALAEMMKLKTELIPFLLEIVLTLRAIERISDHSKNIAQYVFYLAKGYDIRGKADLDIKELIFSSYTKI